MDVCRQSGLLQSFADSRLTGRCDRKLSLAGYRQCSIIDSWQVLRPRLWIIGQGPKRAVVDVVHLLMRVVLIAACVGCG